MSRLQGPLRNSTVILKMSEMERWMIVKKSRSVMNARKMSVAIKGTSPSTTRRTNAMVSMNRDTKRRTKAGLSVADQVCWSFGVS